MNKRKRALKYELTQEENEAARNIALILADTKANIAHLELIWDEAKKYLVVNA